MQEATNLHGVTLLPHVDAWTDKSDPRRERDPRREIPPVLAHEGQLQRAHSSPERCEAMSMAKHRLSPEGSGPP